MSFWDKLFRRKKKAIEYEEEENIGESFSPAFHRERFHVHDRRERETYIRGCLAQIADAEKELGLLEYEYGSVTSHLTDIEELERLPEEFGLEIRETAERLHQLEIAQTDYRRKKDRLSEEEFSRMEQMAEDAEEGIRKLKEAENYQRLVKSDLRKLNGEKHAYQYRLEELEGELKNYAGIAMICFITMGICLLVLVILQFALEFDTKLGYVLVVCAVALVMLRLFLKHNDGQKEMEQVSRDLNRLILLQNTVKIRYVNNKNLLDYLCMKFHVRNAGELETLWNRYQEEKKEREQMEQASRDFVYYQKELLRLLRCSRVKDTSIWLHQIPAILDRREMVELRHNLNSRRKALREQMDYNRNLAKAAQDEVKEISEKYPHYRGEILGWISEYEGK